MLRSNADVDMKNKAFIAKAIDSVYNIPEEQKKSYLESIKKKKKETQGLLSELVLVKDATYMFIVNTDVVDGMFNGATVRLKEIILNPNNTGLNLTILKAVKQQGLKTEIYIE